MIYRTNRLRIIEVKRLAWLYFTYVQSAGLCAVIIFELGLLLWMLKAMP